MQRKSMLIVLCLLASLQSVRGQDVSAEGRRIVLRIHNSVESFKADLASLIQAEDIATAKKLVDEFIEDNGKPPEALLPIVAQVLKTYADTERIGGNRADALQIYERLYSWSYSPSIMEQLGMLLLENNERVRTLALLDTMKRRYPRHTATLQLGYATLLSIGDSIDAASHLIQYLIQFPGSASADSLLTIVIEKSSDTSAILSLIREIDLQGKALVGGVKYQPYYVGEARRLTIDGRSTEALQLLSDAHSKERLGIEGRLMLSSLYAQNGRTNEAEGIVKSILSELDAGTMIARFSARQTSRIGLCYVILNRLDEARIYFRRFVVIADSREKGEVIEELRDYGVRGINPTMASYLMEIVGATIADSDQEKPNVAQESPGPMDMKPPTIILDRDQPRGLKVTEPGNTSLWIAGIVKDDSGIRDVQVNDEVADLVPLREEDLLLSQGESHVVRFQHEIMLGPGVQKVVVRASDLAGNSAVDTATITVPEESGKPAPLRTATQLPKIWAIVIGVSEYHDRDLRLRYADKDAQLFYGFLKSPKGGSIPDDQIELLTNLNATRANILRSISEKLRRAFDDDQVIIYIASHGVPDEVSGELYFLGTDADPNNVVGTGIAQSDIEKAIGGARARKVIMFADACHSGGLGISPRLSARGSEATLTNRLLSKLAEVRDGIVIFTASSSSEYSQEGERWQGHGVYTYHLVDGLKGGADLDGDGIVGIRELYEHVYRRVADDTGGRQHPALSGRFPNDWPVSVVR